ncbi:MAG TPA: ABC transporter permease, partial [Gemmatimonadaceae bacterium]
MRRRFRRLFRHPPNRDDLVARELDDEIQSHLAARSEQLQRLGFSSEDARAEALRRFGDVDAARSRLTRIARDRASKTHARERTEELRAMVGGLRQDVRVGLRALRAHPTFALATVATLGLAVAAAVTAFTFADAIFLRPLPGPAASRLVRVYLPRRDGRLAQIGQGGAALLRDRREIFDRVAVERCCWVKFVRERGALDQRYVSFASAEFFPLLGVTPALGRFFLPQETAEQGREPVAVLSYALWQRAFRGESRIIGEHIAIGARDFTIIGVAPADFAGVGIGAAPAQLWVPPTMASALDIGCTPAIPCDEFDVLALLSPGVSVVRAEAGLANLGAALSRVSIGDDSIRPPQVRHATGAIVAAQRAYSPLARLLGAIATLLLLIACANLSGLLIVRGASRAREMALRRSLGAHRLRIVQQLLVESSILGVSGGALGLALSVWTTSRLMSFFVTDSEGFETYFNAGLNGRIVLFTLRISLLATLLFGVLPALLTTRAQPADVLKAGAPGSGGLRPRLELIALQVALTSALLCGAVLLSVSFNRLLHAQRFEAEHVALFRVRPAAAQYEPARAQRYVRAVAERIAALPEVESVAFARGVGFAWSGSPVDVGVGLAAGDSARRAEGHFVSPDFFRTLRIAVMAGRE